MVVERLIDDEAPSGGSNGGGPQCYVCISSEVTEGNPLIAPCQCRAARNSSTSSACASCSAGTCSSRGANSSRASARCCQAPYALAPPIIPNVEVKLVDQYQKP